MRRALLAAALALLATSVQGGHWPSFRGPGSAGVADDVSLPLRWDVERSYNVLWSARIPGLAHSSPVVWGDRVFVSTAVASGASQVFRGGSGGLEAADDMVPHQWFLYCVDARTGEVRWKKAGREGVPPWRRNLKGSHESATPATDGQRVVAAFGSDTLYCYDLKGALLWNRSLRGSGAVTPDPPANRWGPASSPVIYGKSVIVQYDQPGESYLGAFDLETGAEVWRATRDELPSWSTPLVLTHRGDAIVVANGSRYVRGYDANTGRELWRLADGGRLKVPTPVAGEGLIFVTGGFPPGRRSIYAIRPGVTGELKGQALAWKRDRGSPYTTTPLLYRGALYVCTDDGVLSAYEAGSGRVFYRRRIDAGATGFSASPVAAKGFVYLASEDGEIYVVRAGPAFELVAKNTVGEPCLATPALTPDTMIVRSRSQLIAVGNIAAGR